MSLWLIPCVPAAAAALNGLGGNRLGDRGAAAIASVAAGLSVLLSAVAFAQLHGLDPGARSYDETLGAWLPPIPFDTAAGISVLSVSWTLRLDRLSAVLLLVVSGACLLLNLIVAGRASEARDPNDVRWSGPLNLVCAVTLLTLLAGNFFLMFMGWEALGLCTYLLFAAHNEAADADRPDRTWFLLSSVATGAMLLAAIVVFFTFGTVDFREVGNDAGSLQQNALLSAIVILLCAAAAAKIAQGLVRLRTASAAGRVRFMASVLAAAMSAIAAMYLVARSLALFEQAPRSVSVISAVVFVGAAAATLAVHGKWR